MGRKLTCQQLFWWLFDNNNNNNNNNNSNGNLVDIVKNASEFEKQTYFEFLIS